MILFIFAIALFFRAAFFWDYKNTAAFPLMPYSDSDFYYQRANEIAAGDIFNSKAFMRWPVYAYLLAFLFKLSATNIAFVYWLQFLLGVCSCLLLYFVARILFNQSVGFIAALFYAWYGLFVFYEGLLLYVTVSLFLNLLFFLMLLRLKDKLNNRNLFGMGVFLGICAITQGNILFLGAPGIVWVLWQAGLKFRKLISYFLCFILGLGLILGALLLRSYIVEKDLVLFTGNTGVNFYIGNNPQAGSVLTWPKELSGTSEGMLKDARVIAKISTGRELKSSEVSRFWMNKAADFIKKSPGDYLKLLSKKVTALFGPQEWVYEPEYYPVFAKVRIFKIMFLDLTFILPLAFLGMALNLRNFKKTALLYLAVITLSAGIILFFVQAKFRVMLAPFFMLFAASAAYSLWDLIKRRKAAQFMSLLLILLLFFTLSKRQGMNLAAAKQEQGNMAEFRYHFSKAIGYEQGLDYKSALDELILAERIRPDNHNIIFSFGSIYYYLNRLNEAEAKFKQAISVSPFFTDAYYNLGFLYNQMQRYEEAIAVLKKAVFLEPDDIAARFELAKAYKAKGMFQESRSEFEFILKKTKNQPANQAAVKKELLDLDR